MYFELKYNPSIINPVYRFWAKIIDLAVVFGLMHFLHNTLPQKPTLTIAEIFIYTAFPLTLIVGAILEYFYGASLGKYLLHLKVIDEYGNNPQFLKSLKRNLLSPLNMSVRAGDRVGSTISQEGIFNMDFSNKICHTYVVHKTKIEEIKRMQQEDIVGLMP